MTPAVESDWWRWEIAFSVKMHCECWVLYDFFVISERSENRAIIAKRRGTEVKMNWTQAKMLIWGYYEKNKG